MKKISVTIILLFVVFLGVFSTTDIYFDKRSEKIDEINSLRTDLDLEELSTDAISQNNPLKTLSKLKSAIQFEIEITKIKDYQKQKQDIIDLSESYINAYIEKAKPYAKFDFPLFDTDLSTLDFKTKKNYVDYLSNLKSQFRNAVIAYNNSNDSDIDFELDAQYEIENMTLEEKVGQLFVFAFQGTSLSETDKNFLKDYKVGGLVLLGENVSDESQVTNLTNAIQEQNAKYPLFIMIDQEGGLVKRIYWDDTLSQKEVSNLSLDELCSEYLQRDELLNSLGINWNLGIVADVTNDNSSFIYDRTFSGDYADVAGKVNKAVECSPKVLTTLKHFPGHGATNLDTHLGLATINKSEEEWKAEDLQPFMNSNADSIMIGHLVLKFLDSENPASLSSKVHEYIRIEMHYNGIIVTDDLRMLENASYSKEDALLQALTSDNDVLLYSYNDTERISLIETALSYVRDGQITEEQLNQKLIRIFESKNSIIKNENAYIPKELIY